MQKDDFDGGGMGGGVQIECEIFPFLEEKSLVTSLELP